MSEMKPKKRVNRGFIVSMVLLGAVVLYVIATQLMLIPQRNELKKAADTVRQTFEGLATMTQEDAARLDRNKAALSAKQAEIEAELAPLFVQDSGYLKPAVSLVMGEVGSIAYGDFLIHSQELEKARVVRCLINEDTASLSMEYTYRVSGDFTNYRTEGLVKVEDGQQTVDMTLIFQKSDGEWKLYRVSSLYRDSYKSIEEATA